jgi:hypothetical protein
MLASPDILRDVLPALVEKSVIRLPPADEPAMTAFPAGHPRPCRYNALHERLASSGRSMARSGIATEPFHLQGTPGGWGQ